jgi:hypothetical protein
VFLVYTIKGQWNGKLSMLAMMYCVLLKIAEGIQEILNNATAERIEEVIIVVKCKQRLDC